MASTINGTSTGSGGLISTGDDSGILNIQTNETTAITVDTSQRVGVGTTSPQRKLSIVGTDGATGQTEGNSRTSLFLDNNGANYLSIFTGTSGDGGVFFSDNGLNNGGMVYETSSDALYFRANNAERMRIDSSGNLLVGTTSQIGSSQLSVLSSQANQMVYLRNSNATPGGIFVNYSVATPNNTGSEFFFGNDPAQTRVTLRSNGGIANYSANNVNLSDRREKTNFAPAGEYLSKICAIPVQTFNYIDQNIEEDAGLTLGVIAQDVQAVAPELVSESDWSTEKDGSKMRLSIYQTDLQYALMKSIQELKAINDTQAETINALTARIVALEEK